MSSSAWAGNQVLLTESSRVGLPDKKATELLGRLEAAFSKEQLSVQQVKLTCQGERSCLVAKAKEAGRDAVVSVSLAISLKSVIIDLEAISAATGAVLAQANFKVKPTDVTLPEAGSFARSLGEQLEAEARTALEAKRVADAPVKIELVPPPLDAPAVTVPSTPPSRAPIVITGVAAGVALIAAAVLLGAGLSTQAQLPPTGSTRDAIPLARAQQLVEGANTAYTGALISGGAASALGVTALILAATSK